MATHMTMSDPEKIENEDDKEDSFLTNVYKRLTFISDQSVVSNFLSQQKKANQKSAINHYLYPFSFNLSQQKAIDNAFKNNISVIEGPPGTGKTQTILNIIANAILNQKTVAVLSNNNSATNNVFEKLEKEGLSDLCAKLGKVSNITNFIANQNQNTSYPNGWKLTDVDKEETIHRIHSMEQDIQKYLKQKNEIAMLEQELGGLELEQRYFQESQKGKILKNIKIPNFNASKLHKYLIYLNRRAYLSKLDNETLYFDKKIQIFSQIKFLFFMPDLYKNTMEDIFNTLETTYYEKRIAELKIIIDNKKGKIIQLNLENYYEQYTNLSMKILKAYVLEHYNKKNIYDEHTIKNTNNLIKDYPVILSTTYSLLNCISQGFLFDYIIIDESSQVDVVSAFPALSFAKNVVIVGDSKQLPNIIDRNQINEFNAIFQKYSLDQKFNYTENSLLGLTKKLYQNMPSTMLREHYRCHPKIIEFCNKKFYDNELISLSKSNNDEPIKQYKSVAGNHARWDVTSNSSYNDRQAQIIIQEIIPQEHLNTSDGTVGIITPYRAQKNYLIKEINGQNMCVDTVHGFQGKEKDIIIFSTVSNNITEFLDNPNSINVAVSRAKNKLFLVTPYEYRSAPNSNISNLISYINYNNFKVIQSKINSIFDLLYKANQGEANTFFRTHKVFSKFPSETIAYHTIKTILTFNQYQTYAVTEEPYRLSKIVKDQSILTEEERAFVQTRSHVDFLIYNKFDKLPVLAIEVDSSKYHSRPEQVIRDRKKDSILQKCNIPLLRLKTNECNEEVRIKNKLDVIIETSIG